MMQERKIIIDTNLWISFLLSKKFDFIDKLLDNGSLELVFCDELLTEFIDAATRPKLQPFFTSDDWDLILEIIGQYAVYVSVKSSVTLCRDEKDNFLLSLAKDGKADYLLTGDNDLLVLKSFETTQIITISEFQTLMQKPCIS